MKNLMFYIKFAILLLIMSWFVKAWAVPPEVKAEVTAHPIAHQGTCHWRQQEVMCQIFYNQAAETVYLVIYTNDTTAITHVVKVKDKKETILYVNPKFST